MDIHLEGQIFRPECYICMASQFGPISLFFKKNQFEANFLSMFSSTRWWNKKLDPHHPPVREGRRARRCFATRSIGGGAHHAATAKPQSAPAWLNGRWNRASLHPPTRRRHGRLAVWNVREASASTCFFATSISPQTHGHGTRTWHLSASI